MLSLSLLLAGCIGSDGPVETASDDDAAGPDATPTASTPSADDEADEPDTFTIVEHPVAWSGTTSTMYCLPSGMYSCMGGSLTSGNDHHAPTHAGDPIHGSMTLTWQAETPATAELRFAILRIESCGNECWSAHAIASSTGTSPLTLDTDIELKENETLLISVGRPPIFVGPLFAIASLSQSFSVEGSITSRVPDEV